MVRRVRISIDFRSILVVLFVLQFSPASVAAPWPVKFLRRLIAPFRAHPFLQSRSSPCNLGFANCFLPDASERTAQFSDPATNEIDTSRVVSLELRALHRGPMAHHWLEVESSHGRVTLGFGPATLPFVDAGQISLQDSYGNIERISGMYLCRCWGRRH